MASTAAMAAAAAGTQIAQAPKDIAKGAYSVATLENRPVKGMHEQAYQGPATAEQVAYRNKLATVSDTTKTADNVFAVFGSPKKVFGLMVSILLVILTVIVVWTIFGKKLKSLFSGTGSSVKEAIKDIAIDLAPGANGTLTEDSAKDFADTLYGLFGYFDDDNDGVVNKMKSLKTAKDYNRVRSAWGERKCKKWYNGLNGPHSHDLPGYLRHNLNDRRCAEIRTHLESIGVANTGL